MKKIKVNPDNVIRVMAVLAMPLWLVLCCIYLACDAIIGYLEKKYEHR